MDWGEAAGYGASLLVFAAFYMRGMLTLRVIAIASNAAFIAYALCDGLMPVLLLHSALLPLNLARLFELRRRAAEIDRAANDEFSAHLLMPLMKRLEIPATHGLFRAGDRADELFYIVRGTIGLPEIGKEIGPGSFLGEIALFSNAGRRTATAIARTDCVVMVLTSKAALAALEAHPRLAIHLLRLITGRMLENAAQRNISWPPSDCVTTAAQETERVEQPVFMARPKRQLWWRGLTALRQAKRRVAL
jgi:CRP/FNR family transcriptional regulator, cyclic AMP receptor protein